jgi:hypothetical protein
MTYEVKNFVGFRKEKKTNSHLSRKGAKTAKFKSKFLLGELGAFA